MSKKTKKPLYLLIVPIVILLVIILSWQIFMFFTVKEVKAVPIKMPALADNASGTYLGTYELSPVKVQLKVNLEEGKISSIEILEHVNGLGKSAEEIINQVIVKQDLDVDEVSGATISRKCILKAIENALDQVKENK